MACILDVERALASRNLTDLTQEDGGIYLQIFGPTITEKKQLTLVQELDFQDLKTLQNTLSNTDVCGLRI